MNIIFLIIGLFFFTGLWIILDLKIGRKIYIYQRKRLKTPLCHSKITLYTDGKEFYDALFSALKQSVTSIDMMFFILRKDEIGDQIIHILCKKAEEGIAVRLLLDCLGSRGVMEKYKEQLTNAGVQFSYSHGGKLPFFFFTLNQRNHRKMVMIDETVSFLGGFNIGKEYLGKGPLGAWRDYHLRIDGEGTYEIKKQFLKDWQENTAKKISLPPKPFYTQKNTILHEIISTEAMYLLQVYLKLIQEAKQALYIGSPYFIPGMKIFRALRQAQKKGILLTVLIPTREDHPLVKSAAKPYLRHLQKHGAKLYFYEKGFFHGKVIIVDDTHCLIGTANFDMRSLHMNHEMSCFIHDKAFTKKTRKSFEMDLEHSREITYEDLCSSTFKEKAKEWIALLLSPFF